VASDAAVTGDRPIAVVGIGADGWAGLPETGRAVVRDCDVLMGSTRQLALIPPGRARRVSWPSPLLPALPGLLAAHADVTVCVLASGDPMFYGIGVTLARLVGAQRLRVLPAPSSAALACARLGWPVAGMPVVSVVGRPLETVLPELCDRARLLVLSADEHTPAALAELLARNGFGKSELVVLEQLGGPAEARRSGTASNWPHSAADPLNLVAVTCVADPDTPRLTRLPGLPDAAFGGVGQFTKSEVRALTLCALAPRPGEVLWDVGGGSGSIAIEWCRTDPSCRAVAFEHQPARAAGIGDNARRLGVAGIVVKGRAPDEFPGCPRPDAIFVGGGVSADGVLQACWDRLPEGGRLVANAVTLAGEAVLIGWAAAHPGILRKLQVYRADSVGPATMWETKRPVTQWVGIHKNHSPS
jgi:precorrin-6Y C5,15-methyltransferase (decarboxylating)